MKFILIILLFIGFGASAQTVGQFRYDTTKFNKIGGFNEVKIQNATQDTVGGIFTNVGKGWGKWLRPRAVPGGILIGTDTILVAGAGPGGGRVDSCTSSNDSLYYWVGGVRTLFGLNTNFANTDLTATGDRTHDFTGYNLNINSFNDAIITTNEPVSGGKNQLDISNDGFVYLKQSSAIGKNSLNFADSSSTYISANDTAQHLIRITPSKILFQTSNGLSNVNFEIQTDSSNADPNNVAYFKPDNTLARGHISTSGGSTDTTYLRRDINTNTAQALANYNAIQQRVNFSDTAAMQANEVRSVVLNTPSVIFANPINFTTASHVATGSLSLNNQAAKTVFTNAGNALGLPSFSLLDSSWLSGMHTQGYYDGRYAAFGGSGWGLTGNTGTTPGTNFIGNTDNKALQFKINNVLAFNIGARGLYGSLSTFYGAGGSDVYFDTETGNQSRLIFNNAGSFALLISNAGLIAAGGNIGLRFESNVTSGTANTFYNVGAGFAGNVLGVRYAKTTANIFSVYAQNSSDDGRVTIGQTGSSSNSAILELLSTSKGFLSPRLTTTQKNAIASPATALQLYDTNLKQPQYYDGASWQAQVGMIFGTAVPALTPSAIGNFYLDTTNKKLYVSTGTASSGDWNILN